MLDRNLVKDILNEALSTGGDYAEVFVENSFASTLQTAEHKVKQSTSGLVFGVGIRIFSGVNSVYAYTNLSDRESLLRTAQKAARGILAHKRDIVFDFVDVEIENIHKINKKFDEFNKSDKADLMKKISCYAYESSPLISRVDATYLEKKRHTLVANTLGVWAEDTLFCNRFSLSAIAAKDNLSESAGNNFGGLYGLELFDKYDHREFAEKVAEDAVSKLSAEDCPSGKMDVIIGNGFGGVIFHEACGHGLEAEAVAKNASVFAGKLGQKVASELVTAYDDATIPNAWGSINIDDEGVKTQRKLLIENGILKGYMVDRLNGRRMEMEPNGCARRQNYKFAPTSRMSNTFIANGNSTLEEMIANTEYGLFAQKMSGGSVNTASGEFNFSVDKAFIVEKGKIKQQVKGAKLIGSGIEVLQQIDMVGNDMDLACGMCGASSGSIPTTVGEPAVRVRNITVGGQR